MSNIIIEKCRADLEQLKKNWTIVLNDKYASSGRLAYYGPLDFSKYIPDLIIADRNSWFPNNPGCFYSLEDKTNIISDLSPNRVELITDLFLQKLPSDKEILLLTWERDLVYQKLSETLKVCPTSLDNKTRQVIEDKTLLERHLNNAGCDIKTKIKRKNIDSFEDIPSFSVLVEDFGLPFVIQGTSKGGRGTKIIYKEEDLIAVKKFQTPLRISEFFNEWYSTIYCFNRPVDNNDCDVYVEIPSHKTVDIPEYGIPNTAGAGGDWTIPCSLNVPLLIDNVVKLGKYLYTRYGLVGCWNIEGFMVKDGNFIFNEINARVGGGNEIISFCQIERGIPPFLILNMLVHTDQKCQWMPSSYDYNTVSAREISISNSILKKPFYIKCYSPNMISHINPNIIKGSGLYYLNENGQIQFVKSHINTTPFDANIDQNYFYIANISNNKEITILPHTQFCTIEGYAQKNHVFTSPKDFSPQIKIILDSLMASLL